MFDGFRLDLGHDLGLGIRTPCGFFEKPSLNINLLKNMLQMEEHAAQLREELDREREERNYFQLERDKMYSFMEITQRELEEVKAELKIANKLIEEDEGTHQAEIKVKPVLERLRDKDKGDSILGGLCPRLRMARWRKSLESFSVMFVCWKLFC